MIRVDPPNPPDPRSILSVEVCSCISPSLCAGLSPPFDGGLFPGRPAQFLPFVFLPYFSGLVLLSLLVSQFLFQFFVASKPRGVQAGLAEGGLDPARTAQSGSPLWLQSL